MTNLLVIKAHPLTSAKSKTLQILDVFLAAYQAAHPDDFITTRSLYNEDFPEIDAEMFEAWRASNAKETLTARQNDHLTVFNTALQEFIDADKIVIANPLWNLSVPTKLKSWLDAITVAGKTFKYNPDGSVSPIVSGKNVIHIQAAGGEYHGQDLGSVYIDTLMRFLGADAVSKISVEGMDRYPEQTDTIMNKAQDQAQRVAASF